MAFTYNGHLSNGGAEPFITEVAVSGITADAGSLVRIGVGGNASLSVVTTTTTDSVFGIVNKTVTSSDTVVPVTVLNNGSIVMADVYEIVNTSRISVVSDSVTASATTFDCSAVLAPANSLVGANFAIVSAANLSTGYAFTPTGYTSAGVFTVATAPANFGTGDVFKLVNFGLPTEGLVYGQTGGVATTGFKRIYKNPRLFGVSTFTVSTGAKNIQIAQSGSSGVMSFCRCIGTNDDGTKLALVITKGFDAPVTLATT